MSSKKQQLEPGQTMVAAAAGAPTTDVGIQLSSGHHGMMRPGCYLITVVVTVAPGDLIMYGRVPDGDEGDVSDDRWGLHNDKYGRIVGGLIKAALPVGTHHYIVEDLGIYAALYFTASAGTMNVYVHPISHSNYGS